jgi:hypothetical protein
MAVTLRTYLNNQIKAKGSSLAQEKAKASKYKSIAAAKKAGALYYTNKDGKVMAAVYAEDLKKSAPVPRPKPKPRPKVTERKLNNVKGGRGDGTAERNKRTLDPKSPQNKPNMGGLSTKELRQKQRKLRTKVANARAKGKDDKAASREIAQIDKMIKQRTR